MKKEGYNLSMNEILSSIRSDIFSDQSNYKRYDSYDQRSYSNDEINMSFSDDDNSDNEHVTESSEEDNEILELDDTFLDSQEEEFDLTQKDKVVNDFQSNSFDMPIMEKTKRNKKVDPKVIKGKKTSQTKTSDSDGTVSDDVDQFLKLIEENDSELQFKNHIDNSNENYTKESETTYKYNDDNNDSIMTALSKANELIQKSAEKNIDKEISLSNQNTIEANSNSPETQVENITNQNLNVKSKINVEDTKDQNTSNKTKIDVKLSSLSTKLNPDIEANNKTEFRTNDENIASIMSESAKQASMRSIHKIIETQKKLQNEKRQTIDELAMAALIPMLQDWMDKNLAKIVEKVVEKEISKLINTDN